MCHTSMHVSATPLPVCTRTTDERHACHMLSLLCPPPRLPLQSIFCMLAVATCLRAFALHEYARQLTELAVRHEKGN